MKRRTFPSLSLIWKILFLLVVFQAVVLIGYATLAKVELDDRLIEEKINFKAMSAIYLKKSIENHVQNILDEIYTLSGSQENSKSKLVDYIRDEWPMLSINWGAKGVSIFDAEEKQTFKHGSLNLKDNKGYLTETASSNLPTHYIQCQKECLMNINIPIYLDGTDQYLLLTTSLLNPIIQFQELLNLKSAILAPAKEPVQDIRNEWLGINYEMLRKENNEYHYQLLKKANENNTLKEVISTGAIVNLQESYFFISAFELPFEHNNHSYFLIFNDISHTLMLDKSFNKTYLSFSILALFIMALIVMIVLLPLITRIKRLRSYLPTLARGEEISLLPLEDRKIIFQDEIDILEDTSNELAQRLAYLNDAVKERELELKEMALFDNLTGLPNRGNFTDELKKGINNLEKNDKFIAVIFIDLDRFKQINDTLGHDIGDEVLKAVGKRLKYSIRSSDLVARLGGDEFTILLRGLTNNQNILSIINDILDNFSEPAKIKSHIINIQLSMGVSTIKQANTSLTEVIKQADIAMYDAKANKTVRYSFFKGEMESRIINEFNLLNDFNAAMHGNEFELFFQPFYNLSENKLFGFECLIRWQHVGRGLLAPDTFLPILKDTEHMRVLESWVLEQGIISCKDMNKLSQSPLVFSINLSADMFMADNLIDTVTHLLSKHDVAPALIYIEIVEDSLISDLNAGISRIKELQALGIKVSLDDFGVGYSSLNYLRRLPIDNVKIDRSFVQEIMHHKKSKQLLSSLIDLIININKTVTAEGIEDEDQLKWLKQHDCHIGQGYFFDKPLVHQEAMKLIQSSASTNVRYIDFAQE